MGTDPVLFPSQWERLLNKHSSARTACSRRKHTLKFFDLADAIPTIYFCLRIFSDYIIFDQSRSSSGGSPPTYTVRDVTIDVMDSGIPTKGCPTPDNTVVYKLFPSTADAGQDELTHYAVRCTELASRLTAGHVWHYEPFRVWAWRTQSDGMHGMCLFIADCSHVLLAGLTGFEPPTEPAPICVGAAGAFLGESLDE